MTFFKTLGRWIKGLLLALFVFGITYGICEALADAYKDSEGLVLAKDLIGLKITPYAVALLSLFIYFEITDDEIKN